MKLNPLKSTSTGICQVITGLARLPGSTLCYSLILQLLCLSLSAHLSDFKVFIFPTSVSYAFLSFKISIFSVVILLFDSSSHPFFWLLSSAFIFSLLLSFCCSCYCWGAAWMARRPPSGQISLLFTSICLSLVYCVYCKTIPRKKTKQNKKNTV